MRVQGGHRPAEGVRGASSPPKRSLCDRKTALVYFISIYFQYPFR